MDFLAENDWLTIIVRRPFGVTGYGQVLAFAHCYIWILVYQPVKQLERQQRCVKRSERMYHHYVHQTVTQGRCGCYDGIVAPLVGIGTGYYKALICLA